MIWSLRFKLEIFSGLLGVYESVERVRDTDGIHAYEIYHLSEY